METRTRKVRVNRVEGYRAGEEVDLPTNRALTYCRNGQAEPVGWDDEKPRPINRMLDTSKTRSGVSRKKASPKARKPKPEKPSSSDDGE